MEQVVYGGYRWNQKTSTHLQDSMFLESYGYKVYSQNDEDGILQEIFDRIGTETKKFVEFGVQDGLECNSHYLLHKGWTGLWLEGSEPFYRQIQEKFASVIADGKLKTDNAFITRENINALLDRNGMTGEIDLLCIDLDGNDYHVWDAISRVAPRVVCMEYNGKFPPDCEWVMPYCSNHVWQGNDYFGASLKSLEKLGTRKGYQLVGTNITGVNAFFVRADLAEGKFALPATAENLYNPPQYQTRHITGHPSEFCLLGKGEIFPNGDGTTGIEDFALDAVHVNAQADADALFEMLGPETYQKYLERGNIEVAPLAYMRGRTLDDSFIILDEAQNTSREQMKMFLTRLGFGSKIVITGDATQIDLPDGKTSGLKEAMRVLKNVEGIGICQLTNADVVRHVMVQRIVQAYEEYETHKSRRDGGKRK